ncbi:hypothetical protein GCM10023188_05900 [Pontibacter saemangeumensis]|uniref:Outer membrane protein beta-barrel domain-containing protein n=1 Tax=Pontibacter saemangeumensis TaxID=1084525 RepID=A0ABP8LAD7_9BACT
MKKLLSLFILVAIAQGVQAQTSKGAFVATGSVGYSFGKDKTPGTDLEDISRSYHISPKVGYLVSDKVEVGVFATISENARHIRYYYANNEIKQRFKAKSTQKAAGVYLKRYIFFTDKLALSGMGEFSYSTEETTHFESLQYGADPASFSTSRSEKAAFVAAARPGLSYFLSEKISLNGTFGELRFQKDICTTEEKEQNSTGEITSSLDEQKVRTFALDVSSSTFLLGVSYFF